MKCAIVMAVILCFAEALYSDPVTQCEEAEFPDESYYGLFDTITFEEDHVIIEEYNPMTGEEFSESHPYRLDCRGELPFLRYGEDYGESRLVLWSDRVLLMFENEAEPPTFRGVTGSHRSMEAMHDFPEAFSATSALTEGDTTYAADNLATSNPRFPWVEGVSGHGIGEEIHIDRWFSRLWISIGFVSITRPELYEMNSRPKRLRVVVDDSDSERTFELADTPNPQPLEIPGETYPGEDSTIRLIIEEVYPGTRWEDTCVNFILFF